MSRPADTLLGLALLIALVQWAWVRLDAHVDVSLLPAHARARVRWFETHTTQIRLACLATVVLAVAVQVSTALD